MNDKTETLKSYATQYIRDLILDCTFEPGSEINEKELIQRLNIGRTPIREALLQLQSENYVEIVPRKNIKISSISEKDIYEMYQLRKIIEPQIIVQYKSNYDASKLLNFIDSFKELSEIGSDTKAFYSLDIEFHNYLIVCSQNDILISFYEKLMELLFRVGIYSSLVNTSNVPSQTSLEHEKIVYAILKGNDDHIREAINEHINNSLLSTLQSLRVKKDKEKDKT